MFSLFAIYSTTQLAFNTSISLLRFSLKFLIEVKNVRIHVISFFCIIYIFRYIVVSDPSGVKVGSGGSTLHGLDLLLTTVGRDALSKCKYS